MGIDKTSTIIILANKYYFEQMKFWNGAPELNMGFHLFASVLTQLEPYLKQRTHMFAPELFMA